MGKCPQAKGEKSRDVAAKKAGFAESTTYRRAKKVVEEGTTELVDAMDEGRIRPSVAAAEQHPIYR